VIIKKNGTGGNAIMAQMDQMTQTHIISFNKPIKICYTEELEKRLYFIAAEISKFNLIKDNNQIRGIEVWLLPEADPEAIEAKVKSVIENEIILQKILPPRVIWESNQKHDAYQTDLFEQLLEKGMVHEMGEGLVCFDEHLIGLMDTLDEMIKKMTISKFGAKEYRYPTLISTKALEKCGYFNSFPHMLMFVTRLHNDIDTYRDFLEEYQANQSVGPNIFTHFKNVDYCLPPTMCYHTYHQLQNTEYPETQNQVITSKGKSFRYESKYHRTLERLWDFTIREIVFMGSKDFVIDCRQKYMEASFALIERLGLEGHSEVASDPFFCNADTAAKILNQKVQELKYELRLNIAGDRTIAAASFNFHDQFFGERFNIKRGATEWIRTGCVGFGIERLAFAFISQHGLDEQNWSRYLTG
jgi:seryl-tRNA synthetase